jgi:hypothetical protein
MLLWNGWKDLFLSGTAAVILTIFWKDIYIALFQRRIGEE